MVLLFGIAYLELPLKFYYMRALLFALILVSLIIPANAQLQNFDGIELKLVNHKRIFSDSSDVLVLNVSFVNDGKASSQILLNTMFLVDSKSREFSSTSYFDLVEKGHDVSSKDCPFAMLVTVNPGLSTNQNICYEIPKDLGLTYSLKLYSSTPEICSEPIFDCKIKTYPIVVTTAENKNTISSQIPEWVKNTMRWYVDGKISEQEMINALQFLIKQGIIKV